MNSLLNYIVWDPSDTAVTIGPLALHWYSLCWLVGLGLAYVIVQKLYKEEKVKEGLFDPLFIYCFVGILAGARLGHCLFYQPRLLPDQPYALHRDVPAHPHRL